MNIEGFINRLNDAATNNLLVSYVVDGSTFRIDGGIIDTMSYIEDDKTVEFHTVDKRHIITVCKDADCSFNKIDEFSEEYKFGDLGIIILE